MGSPIDGGVVVVTGASSGIGREIARLVARRAKSLVLVARRKERLEELSKEVARDGLTVHAVACDLADRSATQALGGRIAELVGDVDVLVNNAGVGDIGLFERAAEDKTVSMIELNVTSLVLLTRAVLPRMVERGRGGILNVSSGFGLAYLPGFASYVATKHFVTGFSESLCTELAGTGVRVTQVCPGPVATEFEQNIGNFTGQKAPAFMEISAAHCAASAVRGFDRGRAIVIPGLLMKVVMLVAAWTPRFVTRAVLSLAGRKMRKMQLAAQDR